ncbi:MAG: hypothetical protein M3179_12695 [Actinomycetota bacterium]|nr:hypothetical protein [Actinomycetota bacterium]
MTDNAIVAYVPDLMDRSKVAAAAADVRFVSAPDQLAAAAAGAHLVVVDLTRPGVLEAIPTVSGRVIGFANHTNRDLMEAAHAAGCDEVMARSAFFSRLAQLLDQ